MIHIADAADLTQWALGRPHGGVSYVCVLVHRKRDVTLLDKLEPLTEAFYPRMMHCVATKRVLEWLETNGFETTRLPLIILFDIGCKPGILYQPSLQQVVNLCTGRLFL